MSYTWRAIYNDSTQLPQINQDGTLNAYGDIDQARLASFQLWNGSQPVFNMDFNAGDKLVWRRRNAMVAGLAGEVCHIIGKRKQTGEHTEETQIACVFESDGRVIMSDKFDDKHEWLYPPQLLEHES